MVFFLWILVIVVLPDVPGIIKSKMRLEKKYIYEVLASARVVKLKLSENLRYLINNKNYERIDRNESTKIVEPMSAAPTEAAQKPSKRSSKKRNKLMNGIGPIAEERQQEPTEAMPPPTNNNNYNDDRDVMTAIESREMETVTQRRTRKLSKKHHALKSKIMPADFDQQQEQEQEQEQPQQEKQKQ